MLWVSISDLLHCKNSLSLYRNVCSSLGASHDGSGDACSSNDGFVMSAILSFSLTDAEFNRRGWIFSSCSIDYFDAMIAHIDTYVASLDLIHVGVVLDLTGMSLSWQVRRLTLTGALLDPTGTSLDLTGALLDLTGVALNVTGVLHFGLVWIDLAGALLLQ